MISAGVPHIKLETIYRQSENSYIPMLAKDIKNVNVTDDYWIRRMIIILYLVIQRRLKIF